MHGRRPQSHDLEHIVLELEKTLCIQRRIASKVKFEDKIEVDVEQQPQAPQERPFKDYFSLLANLSTSCIRYPNVAIKSFGLKASVLNCL